jgi:hypothetical protein
MSDEERADDDAFGAWGPAVTVRIERSAAWAFAGAVCDDNARYAVGGGAVPPTFSFAWLYSCAIASPQGGAPSLMPPGADLFRRGAAPNGVFLQRGRSALARGHRDGPDGGRRPHRVRAEGASGRRRAPGDRRLRDRYSSLAYLKRFPVEALKIDQSFVQELGSDPESQAIVAAIVTLAQSLHLLTIAEGIETEDQLKRLRELGCDLLQGYFLAPPKASHLMYLPRRGEKLPPAPVGPLAG